MNRGNVVKDQPDGFVCNARGSRFHNSEEAMATTITTFVLDKKADLTLQRLQIDERELVCVCERCLRERYSWLITGVPMGTPRITTEELQEMGIVGIYEQRPQVFLSCGVCHKSLPVSDPDHVAKVRKGTHQVVHYDCLPSEERDKMGHKAPYVIDRVEEDDPIPRDNDGEEVLRGNTSEDSNSAGGDSGGAGRAEQKEKAGDGEKG